MRPAGFALIMRGALVAGGALIGACQGDSLAPRDQSVVLVNLWSAPPPLLAGSALPVAPRVRVEDASGVPRAGVVVHFVIVEGGGTTSALADTTDTAGEASVNWTLGVRVGTQTLRAVLPFVTSGASASFTVTALGGPAAVMNFRFPSVELRIGSVAPTSISFRDAAGLLVAAPGAISYASADEGIATISAAGAVTGVASGNTVLVATSGTLVDSAVIFVAAGPPTVVATAFPAGTSYGIAITPSRTVLIAQAAEPLVLRKGSATGAALSSITVPHATLDVAMRPDGARALLTPAQDQRLLLEVNPETGTLLRSITVPHRPSRVVYSSDGNTAYATTEAGVLMKVDLLSLSTVTLPLVGFGMGNGLALSPDGGTLALTATNGVLHIISTSDFSLQRSALRAATLQGITFSHDGASLFLAAEGAPLVRLDVATLAVEATSTALNHFDVDLTSDGRYVIATSSSTGHVHVLSPGTLELLTTVEAVLGSRRIAIDPVSGAVWVSTQDSGSAWRLEF